MSTIVYFDDKSSQKNNQTDYDRLDGVMASSVFDVIFTWIGSVEVCFLKNVGYDVTSKTDDVITPSGENTYFGPWSGINALWRLFLCHDFVKKYFWKVADYSKYTFLVQRNFIIIFSKMLVKYNLRDNLCSKWPPK